MFDESSSKLGELSNVSINRDGCGVVLSGVDFDHNAYMHTTDPILGLKFNGNNTNDTYICQAIAPLLLGEIESKALGLTGRESKSSLNTILTEILNGRNYTIILNNETLTIKLEENENCTWLYDINSGLIYDLSNYNNFT